MTTEPHILVVEDEPAIRNGLVDVLRLQGYRVSEAPCGASGRTAALADDIDLILLDIMLPEVDGFTICEETRAQRPNVAICLLTARGSEADILRGFECGADDYVTKPFSVQQLLARVKSLLRRVGAGDDSLSLGGIDLDPAALRAQLGERTVDLTRRDVDVICCLHKHAPGVVDRSLLLTEVWDYPSTVSVETRCVDMHVVKLRRKLDCGLGEGASALIETVRGVGYRLSSEPVCVG